MTCLLCCFWPSNYEKKNEKYRAELLTDRLITAIFLLVGVGGNIEPIDATASCQSCPSCEFHKSEFHKSFVCKKLTTKCVGSHGCHGLHGLRLAFLFFVRDDPGAIPFRAE